MAHTLVALFLVISLPPRTGLAEAIRPEMQGVSEEFVARPADFGFVNLTGLKTDRSRSGIALQHLKRAIPSRIRTDAGQEPRREHFLGSGQAAEQIVIGMVLKERLDLLAILIELLLESAQQFAQAHGQLAFGAGDRGRGFELVGLGENSQALVHRFRAPKPVRMEEFFPAAFAGFGQKLRGGKLDDKVPGGAIDPIVKGLPRRRIILHQGLLKLIDQEGALLNQAHFILAEQAQLMSQWIHRLKSLPALAIDAQRISQTPAIDVIGLGAAGSFALAITF